MKNRIYFGLAIIFLFGFMGSCSAAAIFTDNFESYNVAALNGQGGWVCNISNTDVSVQSSTVKEGTKAAKIADFFFSGAGVGCEKSGILTADGEMTIHLRGAFGG